MPTYTTFGSLGATAIAEAEPTGRDGERVRPEGLEPLPARRSRACAHGDEHDHRRDADHDAEHREPGSQLVGDDAPERDAQSLEVHATRPGAMGGGPITAARRTSS